MAGWDQTFQIDERDDDCFRACMRVWRKTCARHRVEMTYQKWRELPSGRVEFLIAYNLQSINIGPAAGEFLIEMRAVSAVLKDRRQRELPLRLAREIAIVNCWTVREQAADGNASAIFDALEGAEQERVLSVMEDFQSAFWSWRCGLLPPADFVEAQHSLVLELGVVLGTGSSKSRYPRIVDGMTTISVDLRRKLKKLGTKRNRIKHKEHRHEAADVAESYLPGVFRASSAMTGMDLDPISADVAGLLNGSTSDPLRPKTYSRSGEPRTIRR